ncbi:MAG TPA: sensor histidine kinase [Ardenticatenaceae bacterium]|jgi:signal transduction histidine kinase
MEPFLSNLFAANEVVLIATYGQAFFVLGLSVALQWRRESRLELARSVPFLAAFGLIQAFVIWGDIFIPLQRAILPSEQVELLQVLQLLVMLAGFVFLLHFGLRLNWDNPWTPRLPWLVALIGSLVLAAAYLNEVPPTLLRLRFEQVTRPLLVFTASMLAAWGMRNTAGQVEAMGLPRHIVGWLRVAGLSFGAYGVFGGLLIPRNLEQVRVINLAFAGIPVALPRFLAIAVLAWAMIQALIIFRLELQRAMEDMGRLRALASDRQRIGRELHDGTIQAIYGAGLMLENAASTVRQNPDSAEEMLRASMSLLNNTIGDVRHYIFELRDSEGQLAETMGLLVSELREQSGRDIEYRLEGQLPRYPSEFRSHLLQLAREAVVNALRHSEASEIVLSLRGEADALILTVTDNGRGLPPGGAYRPGGQGVPNMRTRADLLGGTLRIGNRPGEGMMVEMVVPHQTTPASDNRARLSDPYEAPANIAG